MVEDCQQDQAHRSGVRQDNTLCFDSFICDSLAELLSPQILAQRREAVGTENLVFEADRPPYLRIPQTLLRFAFLADLLTLGCLTQEVICQRHQHEATRATVSMVNSPSSSVM